MIKLTTNFNNHLRFFAIGKDDSLNSKKQKNQYEILQISLNEYAIVLDKNNCLNELSRAVINFIKSCHQVIDVDSNSFKNFYPNKNNLLGVLIDACEFGNNKGWSLKSKQINDLELNLVLDESDLSLAHEYLLVAQAKSFTRLMQEMPPNIMNPSYFVDLVIERFKNIKNVKITILNEQEIKQKQMNLLASVGQGCSNESEKTKLLCIEYLGNDKSNEKYGFIGKGVCFDSGGLNIKTGNHMRWMKFDMSGAAIVVGLMEAIALNKVKQNVCIVCPLVMNLCGNQSYHPDDVLKSYNGLTVEIDNTDAEGRLILADAITYAIRDLKVNKVFDIATLTGAMAFALGDTYTGVWVNDEQLWDQILKSSQQSAELVWRLPFHHDFKDLLKSNYADICNSVSDVRGGSSRAAMFLKEFTEELPYAHFDIAMTADKNNIGTAVMLHTFYNLLK